MKNNTRAFTFPVAADPYPCEEIFWVVFVTCFGDLFTYSGCINVTRCTNFDYVSNGNRVFVKLKNGFSAEKVFEWVKSWKHSNKKGSFVCGKNALEDDVECCAGTERWYVDYQRDSDCLHKTRRTRDSYDSNPDDEMSQSDFYERENITAKALGMNGFCSHDREEEFECDNTQNLYYEDAM